MSCRAVYHKALIWQFCYGMAICGVDSISRHYVCLCVLVQVLIRLHFMHYSVQGIYDSFTILTRGCECSVAQHTSDYKPPSQMELGRTFTGRLWDV